MAGFSFRQRERGDRVRFFRRLLVLVALMFWQGGFTFYAAVVVPVGQSVLGSHRKQGFITREVTVYLNLIGAAALVPLAWDIATTAHLGVRRQWRAAAWLVMAVIQAVLFWLHAHLNDLMDPDKSVLLDVGAFRTGHRWYLWLSTLLWAAGIAFAVLTLIAWSETDRALGGPSGGAIRGNDPGADT